MRVLLTGASGFLGRAIEKTLQGEEVSSLGRSASNSFVCDLAKAAPLFEQSFDMVIHAAGMAHCSASDVHTANQMMQVNVEGTRRLLQSLALLEEKPKAMVFISSVAVYGLDEGQNISETHPLLATDPYGQSKIKAEEIWTNWCVGQNIKSTILRLPLVVGQKPPGNLNAMLKGIKKGYYFNINGGIAQKSMVLAEDVARVISKAAEIGGIFNLTDGQHPSFSLLSTAMAKTLDKRAPRSLPLKLGKGLARIGDYFGPQSPINTQKFTRLTRTLTFDDSRARSLLNWQPNSVLTHYNT